MCEKTKFKIEEIKELLDSAEQAQKLNESLFYINQNLTLIRSILE
jgi:hypothetical protein